MSFLKVGLRPKLTILPFHFQTDQWVTVLRSCCCAMIRMNLYTWILEFESDVYDLPVLTKQFLQKAMKNFQRQTIFTIA